MIIVTIYLNYYCTVYSAVIFSFLGHFLEVVLVPNHRALQTPPPVDSDVAGAPQKPRQSPAPVMSPASSEIGARMGIQWIWMEHAT